MKKFLAVYTAPAAVMAQMANATPEESAKGMEVWMRWKAKNEKHIVDFGAPLMNGNTLDSNGNWSAASSENSGYSVLQAESADELKVILKDHPHVAWAPGCTIEIREFVQMG